MKVASSTIVTMPDITGKSSSSLSAWMTEALALASSQLRVNRSNIVAIP